MNDSDMTSRKMTANDYDGSLVLLQGFDTGLWRLR